MSDPKPAPLIASTTELKQACVDLANAANELFDAFDEHGEDGPWENPEALFAVVDAFERIHRPMKFKAARRLAHINPRLFGELLSREARGE